LASNSRRGLFSYDFRTPSLKQLDPGVADSGSIDQLTIVQAAQATGAGFSTVLTGTYAVFRAETRSATEFDLFSVALGGSGTSVQLNPPPGAGSSVGYRSATGSYGGPITGGTKTYMMFYQTTLGAPTVTNLYSIAHDATSNGEAIVLSTRNYVAGFTYYEIVYSPGAGDVNTPLVVFTTNAIGGVNPHLINVARIDGTMKNTLSAGEGAPNANRAAAFPAVSPDKKVVSFLSQTLDSDVYEAFLIGIEGTALPVRVSGQFSDGGTCVTQGTLNRGSTNSFMPNSRYWIFFRRNSNSTLARTQMYSADTTSLTTAKTATLTPAYTYFPVPGGDPLSTLASFFNTQTNSNPLSNYIIYPAKLPDAINSEMGLWMVRPEGSTTWRVSSRAIGTTTTSTWSFFELSNRILFLSNYYGVLDIWSSALTQGGFAAMMVPSLLVSMALVAVVSIF
jgi:hypothetical protein